MAKEDVILRDDANAPTGKNDATKVTAVKGAVGAYCWSAPIGTTVPASAEEELDPAFQTLGLISSDGVVASLETESEDSTDMSGDTVHSTIKSRKETFKAKFIELTKEATLKEVYGQDNVTSTSTTTEENITVKRNNASLPNRVYVFDYRLDNGGIMRDVIPVGRVTAIGDKTYNSGEIAGHELTITAALDSSGYTGYCYIKQPKTA